MRRELPGYDEVFAAFGRAMGTAQALEMELMSLSLALGVHRAGGLSTTALEDLDLRLSKKTLGTLLSALATQGYLDKAIHARWFQALDIRNHLAHRFVIDNVEKLHSAEGQAALANELAKYNRVLWQVQQEARAVSTQVVHSLGIDPEELQRAYEEEYRKIMENC